MEKFKINFPNEYLEVFLKIYLLLEFLKEPIEIYLKGF